MIRKIGRPNSGRRSINHDEHVYEYPHQWFQSHAETHSGTRARIAALKMKEGTQVPSTDDLAIVRKAAQECRACPLWKNAIQTVFGEGGLAAKIILVGEQPGDLEDRQGKPFVGPAGRLLNDALNEAGIARSHCYVTNAVKHFKWEPVGKRRIHKKPSPREIAACRPWLEAEVRIIRPKSIVCLGATAARAVLGSSVRVLRDRGRPLTSSMAQNVFVTVHPSMILRMLDRQAAKKETLDS